MDTNKTKTFLQLQCCMLLLFLLQLPEFDIKQIVSGMSFDVPSIICKWVVSIALGYVLYKIKGEYKKMDKPAPPIIMAAGITAILCTIMPMLGSLSGEDFDWMEYFVLIAAGITLYMAPKCLEIEIKNEAVQGAYLIFIAIITHAYLGINDCIAARIMGIVGLVFYIKGLKKLKSALDANGTTGADKLKTAVILALIAVAIAWIPLLGWVAGILSIIAFIMEYSGYGWFTKSDSVSIIGQKGAKNVQWAMIILLIGELIDFLPVVGGTIFAVLSIPAIWFLYSGWSKLIYGIIEYQQAKVALPEEPTAVE